MRATMTAMTVRTSSMINHTMLLALFVRLHDGFVKALSENSTSNVLVTRVYKVIGSNCRSSRRHGHRDDGVCDLL